MSQFGNFNCVIFAANKNSVMNDIQQWLDNPDRDYSAGVELFSSYSPNKMLVRYFQTGTARFRMDKLVYEMGKLAKTAYKRANVETKSIAYLPKRPLTQPIERANIFQTDVPDFINAAKKEISSLYSLIDKQHRELYDLGTSNEDAIVRKRKKLLDGRKPAIERADRLYQLTEEWFNLKDGTAREHVAKDLRDMLAAPVEEQPTITDTSASPQMERKQLRDAVGSMSDVDLTKRRTQLRSSITKTRNMLQYQSIRKSETPAPMPPGPKRDEYEKKLKTLQAEFQAVTDEIERRGDR